MKNTKLFSLLIFVALFGFSACKSTEMAKDDMPADTAEAVEMAEQEAQKVAEEMPEPMVAAQASGAPMADVDVADLVAKHIEARGGKDNIQAIQTIKMTGKLEVSGMEIDMTNYIKRPNKLRVHLVIKSMNAEVNQGYDGTMGWMQNPGSDPQPMPKEMSENMADQGNIDGQLMDYAAKGYSLEYVGEGMVNDSPAHKLKLKRPEHPESIIYIDTATYMEVKIEGQGVNPQTGQTMQTETLMSDYRSVDGIQMAHTTEVKMDGNTIQKMNMETIEVNVDVADSVFEMPGMGVDIK